jgi:hypothetical protein
MTFVRTGVSEEHISSIIRAERTSELGILAVTSVLEFLVAANVFLAL